MLAALLSMVLSRWLAWVPAGVSLLVHLVWGCAVLMKYIYYIMSHHIFTHLKTQSWSGMVVCSCSLVSSVN